MMVVVGIIQKKKLVTRPGISHQPPVDIHEWRTEGEYSDDYMVGNDMNVCFVWSSEDEGWEVYDIRDGSFIQLVVPQYYPLQDFIGEIKCLKTGDYHGDEQIELGIVL